MQCSKPCHDETYDNEEMVIRMVHSQGFEIGRDGELILPEGVSPRMEVPAELIPYCPKCGAPMTMNLRSDDTFVQDAGWYAAAKRYADFVRRHENAAVFYLELGVGMNTPGIIKYPFWQMTARNPKAVYACVNYGEAYAPGEIGERSICINGDIGEVLKKLT